MATEPLLLDLKRKGHILSGIVQSRSDPERQYHPRILMQANILCTCNGSTMRDSRCAHLRLVLEAMDKEELIQFILDGQHFPPPFGDAK